MVPLAFTFLSVPESVPMSAASWALAPTVATSRPANATAMAGHVRTRAERAPAAAAARAGRLAPCVAMAASRRLRLQGRFRLGLRHVFALPFRHHCGCQRVADDVGGGAAHVEELVDAEDQQQAGLGNVE